MTILHPISENLLRSRNALLQKSMRPKPSTFKIPFRIENEYPLVLGPNSSEHSYCMLRDEDKETSHVVAHANLWPRVLKDQIQNQTFNVGLIGNVATDPECRGQGFMKTLFQELKVQAQNQKLAALILWSDLYQFYQNLGFLSQGHEWRFYFKSEVLAAKFARFRGFNLKEPHSLAQNDLTAILSSRYPVPITIERSIEEFKTLLNIPACRLFIKEQKDGKKSFGILGKGYDMMTFVHEWGASSPGELLACVSDIAEKTELQEIGLLAPQSLPQDWMNELRKHTTRVEKNCLCMMYVPKGSPIEGQALERWNDQGFIWGLDSI